MDIFLADNTSLKIIRKVRMGCDLALAPTDVTQVTQLNGGYLQIHKMGIAQLCNNLLIPESEPLRLLVPNAGSRRRGKGISSVIRSRPRGPQPFREVVSADPGHPSTLLPPDGRLFVESPESLVLTMAGRLCKTAQVRGRSWRRCVLMLLKLCLELCGTFSHDPLDPWMGEVRYGVRQVMSAESLRCSLEGLSKIAGLPLAREVVPLVFDGSGSPEESFMGVALFGDSSLGGLQLGAFEANKPIPLSAAQLAVLAERRITPDFSMPQYRLGVEFKGKVHGEGANPERDRYRTLDFQTMGWREFAFWYRDVRTQRLFNASAARIVAAIEQYEGPSARHAFQRLMHDAGFLRHQRTVFEVFRPWLREGM